MPPIFSMLVFTTSMPTPRPEILLTCSAVDRPGAKASCRTSRSGMRAACSAVTTPLATAFALILVGVDAARHRRRFRC